MAVAGDWQKPLAESVKRVLYRNRILNQDELAEAQRALAMLEPDTEGVAEAVAQLENKTGQLEKEYREAADQAENSTERHGTEKGVERLEKLNGYKESAAKIAIGKERISRMLAEEAAEAERQRRRARKKKIIGIAAAVAAVAVLAIILTVNGIQRNKKISELKVQAQTLIDEGKEREVPEVLKALDDLNVPTEEQFSLSRAALESAAKREGFREAFRLCDEMKKSAAYSVDPKGFCSWADEQLKAGTLTPEDGWAVAVNGLENNRFTGEDPIAADACEAYAAKAITDAEEGRGDLAAWTGEMGPYLETIAIQPETALRLCGAMEKNGQDPVAVFPDGILIGLPVGASASGINARFGEKEGTEHPYPDTSRILSVSIKEKATAGDGKDIYEKTYRSAEKLNEGIGEVQADDSHYEVRLLTRYLKAIPEEIRPATFAECTAVIAMQESYFMNGYAYKTETRSSPSSPNYPNLPNLPNAGTYSSLLRGMSSSTSDYRGYFTAMDMQVMYDLRDPEKATVLACTPHTPVIAGEGWFDKHKDDWSLYTEENMLGVHDTAQLKKDYQETIENILLYSALIGAAGSGTGR